MSIRQWLREDGRTPAFAVILGLPFAVILAWAFQLTPEEIEVASDVQPGARIPEATGQRLDFLIICTPVLAVGFLNRVEATGAPS